MLSKIIKAFKDFAYKYFLAEPIKTTLKNIPNRSSRNIDRDLNKTALQDWTKDYYGIEAKKLLDIEQEKCKEDYTKLDRALKFEFIPGCQAYINVRSFLQYKTGDYKAWQAISKEHDAKAGNKCVICGKSAKNQGKDYDTECHEVWSYNTETKTQTLTDLQSLCIKCHQVKHLNAQLKDDNEIKFNDLLYHYRKINKLNPGRAKKDLALALRHLETKQNAYYCLDLSHINKGVFDCHNDDDFKAFLVEFKKQSK